MVNVECVSDFNEQPDLHLSFYYNGVMHNVDIKLPVSFSSPICSFKFQVCHYDFSDLGEQVHRADRHEWRGVLLPVEKSQHAFPG